MSNVEKQIEQWRAGMAESETLGGSTVEELENHLREQMGDLKASGLSDEEAFLITRRRLGETEVLAAEFAKVNPSRRFTNRLLWMATGVLSYFLVFHVSACTTYPTTLLGYAVGLQNPYLAIVVCLLHVAAFAGIGALACRYLAVRSRSQATRRGTFTTAWAGLLVACAIVALYWIENLSNPFMARVTPVEDFRQVVIAQAWVSICWATLMPFLVAGLIALLVLRDRRRAPIPQA